MCCLVEPEWDDESIEEPDWIRPVLKVLEPDAGKLARPVLRGGDHSNVISLLDNLIQDDSSSYRYDALDRLIEVKNGEKLTAYTYDSFHRRLSKLHEGTITHFLYHEQNEIGASVNGLIIHGDMPASVLILKQASCILADAIMLPISAVGLRLIQPVSLMVLISIHMCITIHFMTRPSMFSSFCQVFTHMVKINKIFHLLTEYP